MKRILLIATLSGLLSQASAALDTTSLKTTITDVTVFFSGAEVTRTGKATLKKGKQLFVINKLPRDIDPQSIQVGRITGARTLSVKHELDYTGASRKSQAERDLEDRIKDQETIIRGLLSEAQVLDMEEKLLMNNSNFQQKEAGASIAEIKEAAAYYRTRLNEIRKSKLTLALRVEEEKEKLMKIYEDLNKVTVEKRSLYSQIIVSLEADFPKSAEIQVSYFVGSAGWEPTYDFRVENIASPLKIVYNANVFQSTGEDWKGVNVTLSNNNPTLSGEKPELVRWYANRPDPYAVQRAQRLQPDEVGVGSIKGRVIDRETGEPLPFANVEVLIGNESKGGSTTDFDGLFAIKPLSAGSYTIKASYVGYESIQVNNVRVTGDRPTVQNLELTSAGIELQEVAVMEYAQPLIEKDNNTMGGTYRPQARGARASVSNDVDGVHYRSSKNFDKKSEDFIDNTVRTVVANLEYKIEIPYTIPSDGSDYNIKIKEVSVPATYVHYTAPRIETKAYLTAEITDWADLNLLSGKSSIFYQGTFVGESQINAQQSNDTMKISLGRDGNIVVNREGNKEKRDRRIVGNQIKEVIAWDITVRNNTAAGVKLVIEDQYPLSELKSISIELLESAGAKVDEKTGFLTWELELEAGAKKEVGFTYEIKYYKGLSPSLE